VLPSMDKNYDQKVFVLVGFLIEKPFKGITLTEVLKPALIIELYYREAVILCVFDWLPPPLPGVRDPSVRKQTSEKISSGVAIHGTTVGSKSASSQAFRRCPFSAAHCPATNIHQIATKFTALPLPDLAGPLPGLPNNQCD
jgi:hypothetical protein